MSGSRKKATVRLSFDQKERAIAVLRALIRSGYYGEDIPNDAELSRSLRIPRSSLLLAINHLTAENLIEPATSNSGWHVLPSHNAPTMGDVLFVVNIDPTAGWYSIFQDWLIGFEQIMSQEQYRVRLLCGFDSVEEKLEAIKKSRNAGAMGVVLASRTEPQVRKAMLDGDIPTVVLGNSTIHEEDLGCVCTDNFAGTRKAVEFLISHQHSHIFMYATGLGFHDGFEERYQAYQQTMRLHHLAAHSELIFSEAHNDLTARRAADIIYRMKERPSAILCATDREAFELVAELRHLKVDVPGEISIIGFDNNHFGNLLDPPMTTVDILAANMGQIAGHYLLNEMQTAQMPVKIQVPTELVVRSSVRDLSESEGSGSPLNPLSGETGRILGF